MGGQVMAGGNDVPGAHDGHAFCGHACLSGSRRGRAAIGRRFYPRVAGAALRIATDWTPDDSTARQPQDLVNCGQIN
jgi:hypothetical protein